MAADDAVLIKVAADIASAVAALQQIVAQMGAITESVASSTREAEESEPVVQSFWQKWVTGADDSATAQVAWGNVVAESMQKAQAGLVDAVLAFPKMITGAANLGDHMLTLSNRLDVGVAALSELRYISSQTGAPLEALGRTVFDTKNKITNGGDDIKASVARLRLSLDDLKKQNPEEAFFAILAGIKNVIPATEQSAFAMEVFGSRFRSSSMLLREDVDEIRAKFDSLKLEMDPGFTRAGDAYNDALDTIAKVQEKFANDISIRVLPPLTRLLEMMPGLGGGVLYVGSTMMDLGESMIPLLANLATMTSGFKDARELLLTYNAVTLVASARTKLLAVEVALLSAAFGPLIIGAVSVGALTALVLALGQAWNWAAEAHARSKAVAGEQAAENARLIAFNKAMKTSYTDVIEAEKEWRKRQAEGTAGAKANVDQFAALAARMAAARAELTKFNDAQKAQILAGKESGLTVKEITTQFGLSELAQNLLTDAGRKGAEQARKNALFQEHWTESVDKGTAALRKADKEMAQWIRSTGAKMRLDGDSLSDISRVLDEKYTRPIVEGILKTAEETKRLEDEMFGYSMTNIERRAALINREESREIQSIIKRKGVAKSAIDAEVALVQEKYRRQRADLLKYTGDVVKDAENRGFKLKQQLLIEYATENKVLQDMLKDRTKFTKEVIKKQEEIVKNAKKAAEQERFAFVEAFGTIANIVDQTSASIARLGDTSGGNLGKFAKGYQIAAQYIKDGQAAAKAFAEGNYFEAIMQSINQVINLVGSMWDKFTRSLGEKQAREIGRDFGVNITEAMGDEIAKTSKDLFGGNRFAGAIYHLSDIIREAGGITEKNITQMMGRLRDVFVMVETGTFTVEQARDVIDANFASFAAHIVESQELASDAFLELFELNQRLGIESESMRAFIDGQLQTINTGLSSQVSGIAGTYDGLGERVQKARDEVAKLNEVQERGRGVEWAKEMAEAQAVLTKELDMQKIGAADSADELERVGRLAVASFNAAIAKGADWRTSIEAIGPTLDTITKAQGDLGIQSENSAVKELLRYRTLTQEHKALFDSASTLNSVMSAMSSIGALNAETLADLEAQGLTTFEQLAAAGLDEKQALMQMKDWLVNVQKAHKDLGIPIDENTQSLLDQARAHGVLEAEGTSTNDVLREGLGALIEVLGGQLPEAWRRVGKAAEESTKTSAEAIATGITDPLVDTFAMMEGEQWADFADKSMDAMGDVDGAIRILNRSFGRIEDQLEDTDWTSWAKELRDAAEEAGEAVDGVSLGHSPGGLKEIPIKIREAMASFEAFRRSGVSSASAVESAVNAVSASNAPLVSGVVTTGDAGENTGVVPQNIDIRFEISALDGASVQRVTETTLIPALVKAMKRGFGLTDMKAVLS